MREFPHETRRERYCSRWAQAGSQRTWLATQLFCRPAGGGRSTPLLVALQAPALHEGRSEDSGCVWSTRVRAAAAPVCEPLLPPWAGGAPFADWGSPGKGTRAHLGFTEGEPTDH